jgi:hypothetical protein
MPGSQPHFQSRLQRQLNLIQLATKGLLVKYFEQVGDVIVLSHGIFPHGFQLKKDIGWK